LRRHRGQRPGAFIRQILDEVQRFSRHEQHDDITVLIAECRNGPKLPAISNLS
jgi:serine phosphatase RsbU (regulator of sigma subunit)